MRVLQLIDNLNAGGAERVAVNYANALASKIEGSFLCTTREEGGLKESVRKEVGYLFLQKKTIIDFVAIKKLYSFIKKNDISIVHAHSSSFFLATILKITNPKLVLIWHNHFGDIVLLNWSKLFLYKKCSSFFQSIVTVNGKLAEWAKNELRCERIIVLPNYAVLDTNSPKTHLLGKSGRRIICLANLRKEKDHFTLLKAFELVLKKYPDWTLHLVGMDFEDEYAKEVKHRIKKEKLDFNVHFYGSCSDVSNVLSQSEIAVLSSRSEGFPLALLEYGLGKLPVITTNVGDCNKVISSKDEGLLIPPENANILAESIMAYIEDEKLRKKVSENLQKKVKSSFSEAAIINLLIAIYKEQIT